MYSPERHPLNLIKGTTEAQGGILPVTENYVWPNLQLWILEHGTDVIWSYLDYLQNASCNLGEAIKWNTLYYPHFYFYSFIKDGNKCKWHLII